MHVTLHTKSSLDYNLLIKILNTTIEPHTVFHWNGAVWVLYWYCQWILKLTYSEKLKNHLYVGTTIMVCWYALVPTGADWYVLVQLCWHLGACNVAGFTLEWYSIRHTVLFFCGFWNHALDLVLPSTMIAGVSSSKELLHMPLSILNHAAVYMMFFWMFETVTDPKPLGISTHFSHLGKLNFSLIIEFSYITSFPMLLIFRNICFFDTFFIPSVF